MRRMLSILVILSLIMSIFSVMSYLELGTENSAAAIEISGTISTNQVWDSSDSPIYITGNVTITSGATVIVNPGVMVFYNGSYTITVDDGNFSAKGNKYNPILFKSIVGISPALIEAHSNVKIELDWCKFDNASIGVKLINNQFQTIISNSTFNDSCSKYFELTNSRLNVTSSRFDGKQFDAPSAIGNNLNNKLSIKDENSELYIMYYVNVNTVNGTFEPIPDINVHVSDQRNSRTGRTDVLGQYRYFPATAVKINGTSPEARYNYQTTVRVTDRWHGTSRAIPGISDNQTLINASSATKDTDFYIPVNFMFKYPPKIMNSISNLVIYEDTKYNVDFEIQDNDDLNIKYNNLTINITDQNGRGIYGTNGKDKWISWDNGTEKLIFYRTIESPFTPPGPKNYSANVGEYIYITVLDQDGQKDTLGPIEIEYHNVPDKPVISWLPQPWEVVWVTEDLETKIPIKVTDNDNATIDIAVTISSNYVKYEYNPLEPTTQNLRLFYPNEFGVDGAQELVNVTATDGCSEPVRHTFLVKFNQTPDPPKIIGKIPNKVGFEDTWESDLSLGIYASDPDPDDDLTTLQWYVTGLDAKVYGEQLFTVSNEYATANTPLSFNLNPELDLGGSRNPQTIEDKVTLWLMDKDGQKAAQDISLIIKSTNQPPSLHKVDYYSKKITVVPEEGDAYDTYKFMVEYRDLDGPSGDAPEYVKVYIDGIPYNMTAEDPEDSEYRDSNIYVFEISNLSTGVHEHYFECSDGETITRFPLFDAEPNNISAPIVGMSIYISERSSVDGNFVVRLAHTNPEPFIEIIEVDKPAADLEPNKDEMNKTKGDIGTYFQVNALFLDMILWVEFRINFGSNYTNYDTTWLRKVDMQLAYYSPGANEWSQLLFSQMNTKTKILVCNLSASTGQEETLISMLDPNNKPTFTIVGILDADADNYYNTKDAFPFDPAARYDRDSDGSPGKSEWCPGKGEKDSTTGLHEDKFPDDPAASTDDDNDGCPDEWNPGKSKDDSTTGLTLDMFPNNAGACEDTDGDGQPDVLIKERDTQNLIEDPDDDNDGMPDWWEDEQRQYAIEHNLSHLFDPKNPNDAKEDWDGDGRSNLDEYRDGSNPYKKDVPSEENIGLLNILPIMIAITIILILVGLFMYTKMRREALLENKIRARILDYISKNPGVHYRKILNELNLNMSVLTHHLNLLEQQQYIKSLQDSMYRRFYPISAPINKELILSNIQLKILKSIHDTPGISQSEIARNLGVARKVVNYHIKILSDANFINVEPSGRESQCYYLDGLDYKTLHRA